MRDRLPYRLGLALLLVALFSAAALGASQAPPVLQTPEPSPTLLPAPGADADRLFGRAAVTPGKEFTLDFRVANQGGAKARNIVFTVVPGDFLPSGSGGVISGGVIAPDADTGYSQGLIASGELALKIVRDAAGLRRVHRRLRHQLQRDLQPDLPGDEEDDRPAAAPAPPVTPTRRRARSC